jgi:tripartite-type tricarboxylate transporter receptor subunit TctC
MKILPPSFINAAAFAFAIVIVSGIPFPRDDAWSQARPIRIVVPYAPGGINETMSPLLADRSAALAARPSSLRAAQGPVRC